MKIPRRNILLSFGLMLTVAIAVAGGFAWGFRTALEDETDTLRILQLKNLYVQPVHGGFSAYYLDRVSFFKRHPNDCPIAMIGDSLTDLADWPVLLGRNDVYNRGISGDSSLGLLNRLDETLSCKPKTAFLMIGINDLNSGAGAAWVADNIIKTLKILHDRNIKTVWQTTLKMAWIWDNDQKYKSANELNTKVMELNHLVTAYCQKNHIDLLDVNQVLPMDQGLERQITGYWTSPFTHDGLHLSGDAYDRWADLIRQKIGQLHLPV